MRLQGEVSGLLTKLVELLLTTNYTAPLPEVDYTTKLKVKPLLISNTKLYNINTQIQLLY